MRFLLLCYGDESGWGTLTPEQQQQIVEVTRQNTAELKASGHYVLGAPLQPTTVATSVRVRDGKRLVTTVATLNGKGTEYVTALWELDPAGEKQARRITRSAKGEAGPAFAANGDLYFTSARPDPETPIEESMGALAHAVRSGKALYAGISNYGPDDTRRAYEALKAEGVPLLIHQPSYSMFNRLPEEGLLDATPALVVTAHPSPRDTDGFEIISKPFDLDELVSRVRHRLENGAPRASRRSRPVRSAASRPGNDGHDDCPEPIELILYVSADSPRSATAIKHLKAALRRYESSRVRLTICDLSKETAPGCAASVAFTPTLVRRSPGPRTHILGHLTSPELLLELLDSCEEN